MKWINYNKERPDEQADVICLTTSEYHKVEMFQFTPPNDFFNPYHGGMDNNGYITHWIYADELLNLDKEEGEVIDED